MARLTYSLLSFTLILLVLPSAFAGPACASRLQSREGCVEACGKKWGWKGMAMGVDRWGAVLECDKANNVEVVKAKACRVRPSKSPPAAVAGSPPSASSSGENRSSSSETPPSPASVNAFVTTTSSKSFKARPTSKSLSTSTSKAPAPKASSSPPPPPKTSNPPPKPTPEKPSSGGPSGGEIDQYLGAHNNFRAQHGAKPLIWNDRLASKAREWAQKCAFKHSGGSLGPFGENLAAGTGDFSIDDAVQGWKDEASDYDPKNPQASHFTQVVWQGTTELGCGHFACDGIFDASFGKAEFHVCEYQAAGNVQGQFQQNVQP